MITSMSCAIVDRGCRLITHRFQLVSWIMYISGTFWFGNTGELDRSLWRSTNPRRKRTHLRERQQRLMRGTSHQMGKYASGKVLNIFHTTWKISKTPIVCKQVYISECTRFQKNIRTSFEMKRGAQCENPWNFRTKAKCSKNVMEITLWMSRTMPQLWLWKWTETGWRYACWIRYTNVLQWTGSCGRDPI